MKKILLGLIIVLMMTSDGYAEIKLKETKVLMDSIHISTVCVDGYKFVIAHRTARGRSGYKKLDEGISTTNEITQHYSYVGEALGNPPLVRPTRCEKE